jgi:hypothetical protein
MNPKIVSHQIYSGEVDEGRLRTARMKPARFRDGPSGARATIAGFCRAGRQPTASAYDIRSPHFRR